ncbi:MAG: DUF2786 domain-containing protein [Granulosicoccus sp.]
MNQKDREKLLARVRKLYAMSQESESSPHEAEIAMRRCQSLMDRFGVTEAELETSDFGASHIDRTFRAMPTYVNVLGSAVALLHDCLCVRSNTIEFRGFSIDAEVAALTYSYLTAAMERSLSLQKRSGCVSPGRAASFDYRVGYALAVLERARAIIDDRRRSEEARVNQGNVINGALVLRKQQMVRDACMDDLVDSRPRKIRYRDGDAHRAGHADGNSVSLDTQLGNPDRKSLG